MRVVVIGAGLSGLFTAAELVAAGIDDLLVVERSVQPGGVARTITRQGFALEPGAGSMTLPHPHLGPILGRIGAATVPAGPVASMRYVYHEGDLVPLPASPKAALAPLLPLAAKLRALGEPLVRASSGGENESLADFCSRRFGERAGEVLSWLMAAGVFAGDPHRLSVRAAFPGLAGLESAEGSVLLGALRRRRARPREMPRPAIHLPLGGMGTVAETAAAWLGKAYRAGFEVGSISRDGRGWIVEGPERIQADVVVVSCRPELAARMVGGDLGAHLEQTVSAPVVVVGLGGKGDPLPPGFGVLSTPGSGWASVGMLFESSYAPDRAPAGSWLVKAIAGGATRPEVVGWDDERLVQQVGDELVRAVGVDLEASFTEVVRHRPGIPQYEVGHDAWLAQLDHLLSQYPGLYLTGWGYRGVGVAQLASDAASVAQRITEGLSPWNVVTGGRGPRR